MRQRSSAFFNLACSLVVLSAAAAAYGIASRPGAPERVAYAKPAETVVARVPDRNLAAGKLRLAAEAAASDRALLDPHPTYPQAAPVQVARVALAPIPALAAARKPAPIRLASVDSKPALPPVEHTRPGAVLNDAQIASIKRRLNLTPDQERMWPSVEAALRNLSYGKTAQAAHKGPRDALQAVASIDPSGADVQNLKTAAFPLIMSFSDDQMRELKDITRVAGLDKLVSNF
jgi:hypothetical protein